MLLSEFIRESAAGLEAVYPQPEARSIVSILVCERLGVQSWTHVVEPLTEIPSDRLPGLQDDMRRLLSGEPLQYVLGYADFCDHRFKVSPAVLIPRPETEQMVQIALSRLSGFSGRILDLCTGSGCIAWSLAWALPKAEVIGVDISEEALAVASNQFLDDPGSHVPGRPSVSLSASSRDSLSDRPGVLVSASPCDSLSASLRVSFLKADVLDYSCAPADGKFDFIISNPPYIKDCERAQMRRNVLDFEPDLALFVPDSDPLLFYRAVAHWASELLTPQGCGIVEINETLGEATSECFRAAGFSKIEKIQDFFGKDRFVFFSRMA